jgi:5-methylcytosine-specific restriction protein A
MDGGKRGTSAERGYDAAWRRFRLWFLHRYPICADCLTVAATDVHHVEKLKDRPDLRLTESNCSGLCGRCHKIRTARGE